MFSRSLWHIVALMAALSLVALACSGGDDKADEQPDTSADTGADTGADAGDDADDDAGSDSVTPPGTCLEALEAAQTIAGDGLDGPVEVVFDEWGVPHIFATTEADMFYAEGFVVAFHRIIQMHAMRRIPSGTWSKSPAAGAGDLSTDVYMRLLNLRGVAEEMWADIQANEPEVKAMLESFAEGVNAYIAYATAKPGVQPFEWMAVGEIEAWTPVDSLVVARLQSWDLSFEGNGDKIKLMAVVQGLAATWAATPLAGLLADLVQVAPSTDTLSLPPSTRGSAPGATAAAPTTQRVPSLASRATLERVLAGLDAVPMKPGVLTQPGFGSNNWIVAGAHTASGAAMLANDTHLSLRNPAVFFEIHMNTARAGGDIDLAGVCFPGIPGVILGHNGKAAWGATVYYADVTDVYVEAWTEGAPSTVLLDGAPVEVTIRDEVFDYARPDEGCEAWIDAFIGGTSYDLEEVDGRCQLTVHVEVVPHHGPVIPGSKGSDGEGNPIALTWKWTGFEPTSEMVTAHGFLSMDTPEGFLTAAKAFGVGAQNWVYADVDGHIAYAAYARVPVRKHLAEGDATYPTWFPMPGTGCCEWTGFVPLEDLPSAVDPDEGYLFTANGDALGHTLDGDPFNDATYQGYGFANGHRATRIEELFEARIASGEPFDLAAMQRIQADVRSPMGARMTGAILAAVAAGEAADAGEVDADPALAGLVTEAMKAARDRLADWDFEAAAGSDEGATEAQKESAVATSIFNAWLIHVIQGVLVNKGVPVDYDRDMLARLILRMVEAPETLATWDETLGDSLLWDDPTTADVVESRHLIIIKALDAALAFLSNPDVVGPAEAGGFGTDDMSAWMWGDLHTLQLTSALGGEAFIPPVSVYEHGFPRPGDMYGVNAANPGIEDTSFRYSSGAAIRNVFTLLPDGIQADTVIPGGEDARAFNPHYADQMELWVRHQTHPLYQDPADIEASAEACWRLE